ncbi:MAG: polyprenyl synthetase family protein [Oscillospiraceae bacterium]|nr:polyprenyl synthetase family protein [Oscillospiraceae bacterium]
MTFDEKYKEYKEIAEKELGCASGNHADSRCSPLRDVINYSLESGGKRIRPVLTLAFCGAYGGNVRQTAVIAAAIEILHTSTLIQDDLPCMDNDDFRRGKPAVHKAFSEADVILAASRMVFKAIESVADLGLSSVISMICRYMSAVYDGQKLDLSAVSGVLDKPQKLHICELKTCALIQAACEAGVLSAGGSGGAVRNAALYAYNLGLAFQLIDDILDGEGYENAAEDAEKYTGEALKLLENVPDNEFLIELTKNLLNRKN